MRFIDASGVIRPAAGTCGSAPGYLGDGEAATAPSALLNSPAAVAYDGGIFISEQGSNIVRYVSAAGTLSTVAGVAGASGTSGDGAAATAAFLNAPLIGPDGMGWWVIADTGSSVVRRLALQTATQSVSASRTASASPSVAARSWMIFRAAGTGTAAATGEGGPATAASIGNPGYACADLLGAGGFYFSDQSFHTVKRVFGNGTLLTVAGVSGSAGYSGEGLPARSSLLGGPTAVAMYNGGILINCRTSCRIMLLSANGATLSTAAGTGTCTLSGDGGQATSAAVNGGWGAIAADPAGPGGGWVFADQVRRCGDKISSRLLASLLPVLCASPAKQRNSSGEHSRQHHPRRRYWGIVLQR